jgi:hypothetical protein
MNPKVKVVTGAGDEPTPVEIIEKSIVDITAGMKKLNSTRLTRRALILLIADSSHVNRGDVSKVLDSLDQLETLYLKKVVK